MEEKNKDGAPLPVEKPVEGTPASPAPGGEPKKPDVVDTRDYKAELEDTKKRLGQAEHTIVTLKKGNKDEKENKEGDQGESSKEDKEEIVATVDEKLEQFKLEQSKDVFEEELSRLSDNPDKRELLRLTYEKKIVKEGFSRAQIQADLASALAIVDRPRIEKNLSEMKQTIISGKTINTVGSATGQDIGSSPQPGELTEKDLKPGDRILMKRHGLTLEDVNKNNKK